jgi:salicylate hydroxylase
VYLSANSTQAGLQLTPNATRLFKNWGVYEDLVPFATCPGTLTVRRYDGTKTLAQEPLLQEKVLERYGSPFWDVHRVDLQKVLVRRCEQLGVTINLGARIVDVDFDEVTLFSADGRQFSGDIILCTDGLWSSLRSEFVGRPSPAVLTGDFAYRVVLNMEDLHGPHRDELADFMASSTVNFWAGPYSHVVSYTVRAGKTLNVGLVCPDNLPKSVVKVPGDLEEMKRFFDDWDPLLQKILGQVESVHKWKLMWLEPLEEWTNEPGTFFMAGDSCHPMIPYLAQGANSALEDGAVFGYLLSKVSKSTKNQQLPKFAKMYEKLRMERGKQIQLESFKQRDAFHMPDGEAQIKRDELMLSMLGREPEADFPSRWTCPRIQRFLYGYDAYDEAGKMYTAEPF